MGKELSETEHLLVYYREECMALEQKSKPKLIQGLSELCRKS